MAGIMADRNKYILDTLAPLDDPSDDRFQRKLLSVMKVHMLSQALSVSSFFHFLTLRFKVLLPVS